MFAALYRFVVVFFVSNRWLQWQPDLIGDIPMLFPRQYEHLLPAWVHGGVLRDYSLLWRASSNHKRDIQLARLGLLQSSALWQRGNFLHV